MLWKPGQDPFISMEQDFPADQDNCCAALGYTHAAGSLRLVGAMHRGHGRSHQPVDVHRDFRKRAIAGVDNELVQRGS